MDFASDKTMRKWGERTQKRGNNKVWGSKICKKPTTKSLDDPELHICWEDYKKVNEK